MRRSCRKAWGHSPMSRYTRSVTSFSARVSCGAGGGGGGGRRREARSPVSGGAAGDASPLGSPTLPPRHPPAGRGGAQRPDQGGRGVLCLPRELLQPRKHRRGHHATDDVSRRGPGDPLLAGRAPGLSVQLTFVVPRFRRWVIGQDQAGPLNGVGVKLVLPPPLPSHLSLLRFNYSRDHSGLVRAHVVRQTRRLASLLLRPRMAHCGTRMVRFMAWYSWRIW